MQINRDFSLSGPWIGALILVASIGFLMWFTRSQSLEDKHAGKTVLRVSFEMNLSEINEVWNSVKSEFEAKHPGVVIVLIDDINQKASIYQAADMLPDVIATNTFSIYRLRKALLPLKTTFSGSTHPL